ncbi:MDIS1-interacting receptor like kinase 2 [Citrus sinensis]|nr:MDIS1-interacting receptor like kinase 2 [Citrus sinensis]
MEEGIVGKKIQPVVSPKTSENPGGAKRNSCGFSSFNRRCSSWFSVARMAGERRLASKLQIGTKLGQKGGRKWEIWPGHNDFWKNEEGFKRKQIIRATNNFDAKYCISTGGQASVYKAELPSWEIVAVKKFHSPHPDMVAQQAFSNEIKALTELRHRNIVKFYGFSFHPRQSFLLYEYLGRVSLAIILSNDAAIDEFSWTVRMNVIKSVANTLSYMHHDYFPPIVHRDISSKNVLLGLDYDAHVSDFGISKFLKPDSSNWSEFVGTFGYVAPV